MEATVSADINAIRNAIAYQVQTAIPQFFTATRVMTGLRAALVGLPVLGIIDDDLIARGVVGQRRIEQELSELWSIRNTGIGDSDANLNLVMVDLGIVDVEIVHANAVQTVLNLPVLANDSANTQRISAPRVVFKVVLTASLVRESLLTAGSSGPVPTVSAKLVIFLTPAVSIPSNTLTPTITLLPDGTAASAAITLAPVTFTRSNSTDTWQEPLIGLQFDREPTTIRLVSTTQPPRPNPPAGFETLPELILKFVPRLPSIPLTLSAATQTTLRSALSAAWAVVNAGVALRGDDLVLHAQIEDLNLWSVPTTPTPVDRAAWRTAVQT